MRLVRPPNVKHDEEDEIVQAAAMSCSGGIVEDQVATLLRP